MDLHHDKIKMHDLSLQEKPIIESTKIKQYKTPTPDRWYSPSCYSKLKKRFGPQKIEKRTSGHTIELFRAQTLQYNPLSKVDKSGRPISNFALNHKDQQKNSGLQNRMTDIIWEDNHQQ